MRTYGWGAAGLALALATGCGKPGDEVPAEVRTLAIAATTLSPEETLLRCDALRADLSEPAAEPELRRIEENARSRRRTRDRDRDREACLAESDRLRGLDPLHLYHVDRVALLKTAAELSDDPSGLNDRIAALESDYRELLLGHWLPGEEEDDALTVRDRSAHGHHGALRNGATRTEAPPPTALRFDGIDDHVELPITPVLSNLNRKSYSISAWFAPDHLPGGTPAPSLEKPAEGYEQFGIVMRAGYHEGLTYTHDGRFIMYHWLEGEENTVAATWDSYFPPKRFYHIVGVVDREQEIVWVYVNGRGDHLARRQADLEPRDYGTTPWRFGIGEPVSGSYPWPSSGQLRDVRIFGRALSKEEARRLYEQGRPPSVGSDPLVGHWPLDALEGPSPIRDLTDYGNHALTKGDPILVSSADGKAIRFDGVDDYLQLPNSPELDTVEEGDFTLCAWFHPDRIPTSHEAGILVKADGRIGLAYSAAGEFMIKHSLEDLSWVGVMTAQVRHDAGRYYHVVGVVERFKKRTRLHIDGGLKAVNTWSADDAPMDSGVRTWKIGTASPHNKGAEAFAAGIIDDVRIYRRALSEKEIKALHDEGRPR